MRFNIQSLKLISLVSATFFVVTAPSWAGGTDLTRRGFLLRAGAAAVAVSIPKIVVPPVYEPLALNQRFMVIDEMFNMDQSQMQVMRRLINGPELDLGFDSLFAKKAAIGDLGWKPLHLERFVGGSPFNGIVRTVRRETMKAVEDMTKQITAPTQEEVRMKIDELEPPIEVSCELMLEEPKELLVIEKDEA